MNFIVSVNISSSVLSKQRTEPLISSERQITGFIKLLHCMNSGRLRTVFICTCSVSLEWVLGWGSIGIFLVGLAYGSSTDRSTGL